MGAIAVAKQKRFANLFGRELKDKEEVEFIGYVTKVWEWGTPTSIIVRWNYGRHPIALLKFSLLLYEENFGREIPLVAYFDQSDETKYPFVAQEEDYYVPCYYGVPEGVYMHVRARYNAKRDRFTVIRGVVMDKRKEMELEFTLNPETDKVVFHDGYIYFSTKLEDNIWVKGTARCNDSIYAFNKLIRELRGKEPEFTNIRLTVRGRGDVTRFYYGKPSRVEFDDAEVIVHNLQPIIKVYEEREDAKIWRAFIREVRQLLRERAVKAEDVEELAEKHGVTVDDAEELLEELSTRPEYDMEYFRALKARAIATYYWRNSFIFTFPNCVIIEEPVHGRASYIFVPPKSLEDLVGKLAELEDEELADTLGGWRKKLLASEELQVALGFQKRIIHTDYSRWLREIEEVI